MGSPTLIIVVANSISSFLHFSFTMQAAGDDVVVIGSILSVFQKVQGVVLSVCLGFCQGFLTSGSFSIGALQYRRFIRTMKAASLFIYFYCIIVMILFILRADWIAQIWLETDEEIKASRIYMRVPFYTLILFFSNEFVSVIMIATGHTILSNVIPVVNGIFGSCVALIMYFTNKNDALRMMYCYNIIDGISFVMSSIVFLTIIKKLPKHNEKLSDAANFVVIE